MPARLTICGEEAFLCAEQMRMPPCLGHVYFCPKDSALTQLLADIRPCRLPQEQLMLMGFSALNPGYFASVDRFFC